MPKNFYAQILHLCNPCYICGCRHCKVIHGNSITHIFPAARNLHPDYAVSRNSITHFMQYATTRYSIYAEIDFCIKLNAKLKAHH